MADAPRSSSPADVLSRFLATSPTLIQEKIRCVFDKLKDVEGVVQFWAPVKTTGKRWLLTTFDQPFVVLEDESYGEQYRLCSERYQYNLDMHNSEYNIDRLCSVGYKYLKYFYVDDDPTIINGAPSRAFLNRMPELLPDLRVHRMSPLESSALLCSMPRAVMLPVFDPSESCCVGVIEYSTTLCFDQLDNMLRSLHYEFEKVGLKTFHAKPPYETVCGLANARDEINKALKIISPKFRLDLVQVWIAYKNEKYVAFSSALEDCRTERMLGIKLLGHCSDYDSYDDRFAHVSIVGYSNICNRFPLKMGKGLIGKTLKNHKPRFIKKVSKLSDNQPLMMLRYHCIDGYPFECSCFVICLRSSETSDFDYVFEFLWHELPNYAILLESLLLSLKRCLPNFKYASGGELGDELPIIDVEDSTKGNTKFFKIFKRNKSSSASESEALEKMSSAVKTTPISLSQEGMIEAAKNLDVSLSTLKRKRKDRSDTNEEEKGAFQDSSDNREMYLEENTLTIKAECADDMIKFTLPLSSATFAAILVEIGKRFKLDPASYKLKYLDEDGDWILLTSDEDMKVCIKERRNLTSIVRLRLLPRQPSDPSHTYQGT